MREKETVLARGKSVKKATPLWAGLTNLFSKVKKGKRVVFLVAILLIFGVLYRFKNQLIVATVNGQPISRLTLIRELEKQAGKRTLDALVTKTLIFQEAKKQGVTVSDEEIDQEVKRIEESLSGQGQDLNQLLALQGGDRSSLKEQIGIQKMIEKIIGGEIEVSDEEVDDYFKENEDSFPEELGAEEVKVRIKQEVKQQKLTKKAQSWIQSLSENAKINYLLGF